MAHTIRDERAAEPTCLIEPGLDVLSKIARLSPHEAQVLTSEAADAIDDRLRMLKRTAKGVRADALNLREDVTYRIKREPLKSIALALGVVAFAGFALAMLRPRAPKRPLHQDEDDEC